MKPYTRKRPAARSAQHRPGGPLASVLMALRKLAAGGNLEGVLTMAVGKQMARQVIELARRVRLRDITSPDGGGQRDSRRAQFEGEYVHRPDAGHLRRLVGVFLSICSWMGPNARTGHEQQAHELNVARLARYHGVSADEVTRYVIVLRDAGVLRRWQPKHQRTKDGQITKTHGCQTGPSGHAYNLYHLVGGLPEELAKQLQRFHWKWWGQARDELTPSARAAHELRDVYAELDDDQAAQEAMRFVERLRPS